MGGHYRNGVNYGGVNKSSDIAYKNSNVEAALDLLSTNVSTLSETKADKTEVALKADQLKVYGASNWIEKQYNANEYAIDNGMLYRAKIANSVRASTHSSGVNAEWEWISLETLMNYYIGINNDFINEDSRVRNNITSRLGNLAKAVAEQNLRKYGYKIGDYFVGASGYTYILGDPDLYYGGYNNNATVATHHIGILVNTHSTSPWLSSGTVTSYASSTLHSYLTTTVLDNIKSDFIKLFGGSSGLEHLLANSILNNAVGGWGSPMWITSQYIRALTEVQIYGSRVFGVDGYQTGDGCKKLEVFSKYKFNELFGNIWFWLKSISSASGACNAGTGGGAHGDGVVYSGSVVALILFY